MKFELTEDKLVVLCTDAVSRAITESFSIYARNDARKKLEEILVNSVDQVSMAVRSAIDSAITEAVKSPEFKQAIITAAVKTCADKFGGAFEGVLKRAGVKAAQTALLDQQIKADILDSVSKIRK